MRRLSVKVFLMVIACLGAMTLLTTLFIGTITWLKSGTFTRDHAFIFSFVAGIAAFGLFTLLVNRYIIRRIKRLRASLKEVSNGNYDIEINPEGNDEISDLINDFNIMSKELKSNDYLNREFVKTFSHEFKTPVSSIKGFAELMKNNELSKEEIKEYAGIISDEATRLSEMSYQMLQIIILDSSNLIKKEDTFSVDAQVRKIILNLQRQWQAKGINFDIDMEEITIQGNEELTYLIWQNLISNAVQYTKENGNISVRLFMTEALHFTIADDGLGIPENDKPHIFQQFYTVNKNKTGKSTGLGLSLTKRIVDKLEGNISFESTENVGSTFIVNLPMTANPSSRKKY